MSTKTLIRGGHVLTVDRAIGDLPRGDVLIEDGAIVAVQPEIGAAWGTFGAVFTSIAVAHTLYAPRRVLWNWRRIALLGLSLALAVGSQFSLWVVLLIALVVIYLGLAISRAR